MSFRLGGTTPAPSPAFRAHAIVVRESRSAGFMSTSAARDEVLRRCNDFGSVTPTDAVERSACIGLFTVGVLRYDVRARNYRFA